MFRPEIRVTAQKGVSNHNRGSETRRQIDTAPPTPCLTNQAGPPPAAARSAASSPGCCAHSGLSNRDTARRHRPLQKKKKWAL
ncbi:unnamed protein product [Boreogadus saida]